MTIDSRRWLARAGTAVHHRDGNVQEIIGVGRDLTEPKKAGDERQKRGKTS